MDGNIQNAVDSLFSALLEEGLLCNQNADERKAAEDCLHVWSNGEEDYIKKKETFIGFRVFCKKSDTLSVVLHRIAKRLRIKCKRADEKIIDEHRILYARAIRHSVAKVDCYEFFYRRDVRKK